MTTDLISIGAILLMLLVVGGIMGALQRGGFSFGWLLVAAGLVLLNDALLTNFYHHGPRLLPTSSWNWQGKLFALLATLVIAALPRFGWRKCGLTFRQNPKGRRSAIIVALLVCAVFIYFAIKAPNGPIDREALAFQLTMPGLEEEPFYRGILLLALNEAFRARANVLGVQLGWGGILSCALFGLAHAFGYSHGAFHFEPMAMALTAGPALILVWLRERTGSVLLPILLHNFGNSISILI
ncbi:CPBP family intramembrane glutamic endopeptidase, BDIM_20840 family [Sphingomonas sp.]|uniref:CPBP family intramembrane glutamic endopeptidase, BDIM_20840 family n=1 Tax=Sphingomonas sp. TaxID=28214 RepID=UPI003B3B1734